MYESQVTDSSRQTGLNHPSLKMPAVLEGVSLSQYFPWMPQSTTRDSGALLAQQPLKSSKELPASNSAQAATLTRLTQQLQPSQSRFTLAQSTAQPDSISELHVQPDDLDETVPPPLIPGLASFVSSQSGPSATQAELTSGSVLTGIDSSGQDYSSSSMLLRSQPSATSDKGRAVKVREMGPRTQPSAAHSHLEALVCSATEQVRNGEVTFSVFEDRKLPGYHFWQHGPSHSLGMHARVPKQLVGWRAVLTRSGSSPKRGRFFNKGNSQGTWEVRQESLKNSYEFRQDSEIQATMHDCHRLFKHEWSIIVKDGTKFVWKMSKTEFSLYRDADSRKVAEYQRALSSDIGTGLDDTALSQAGTKIGSITYFGHSEDAQVSSNASTNMLECELAIASLVAIMAARGGPHHITARFEASSDPLREVLQKNQEQNADREEMMRTLPRPGFARDAQDAESVLSDTTDEDGPSMPPVHLKVQSNNVPAGKKRFSFLGRSLHNSGQVAEQPVTPKQGTKLTDSQRIVNHYRSKSLPMQ